MKSLEHFQAAFKNPLFAEHTTQVREARENEVDFYEVYSIDQRGMLPDHTTSKTTQNLQQALMDILVEHHELELRHLPGFVSVSFHRGLRCRTGPSYQQST